MVGEGRGIYIQRISGVVQIPQTALHPNSEGLGPPSGRRSRMHCGQKEKGKTKRSQGRQAPGKMESSWRTCGCIDYERGSLLQYGVKPVSRAFPLQDHTEAHQMLAIEKISTQRGSFVLFAFGTCLFPIPIFESFCGLQQVVTVSFAVVIHSVGCSIRIGTGITALSQSRYL
jgi:hypothetical protein